MEGVRRDPWLQTLALQVRADGCRPWRSEAKRGVSFVGHRQALSVFHIQPGGVKQREESNIKNKENK